MPRPRFDRLDPEVRDRILDVAAGVFAEQGFHDASYNGIIQQTGISKGSFYYYFDDKADLYATTLARALARAGEGLGGLWDGEDDGRAFWDQVRDLVGQLGLAAATHPEAIALAKAGLGLTRDAALAAIIEAGRTRTAAILALGQARGAVRDDLPMDLLVGVVMGIGEAVDRYLLEAGQAEQMGEAEVEVMVDLFRRVVGA